MPSLRHSPQSESYLDFTFSCILVCDVRHLACIPSHCIMWFSDSLLYCASFGSIERSAAPITIHVSVGCQRIVAFSFRRQVLRKCHAPSALLSSSAENTVFWERRRRMRNARMASLNRSPVPPAMGRVHEIPPCQPGHRRIRAPGPYLARTCSRKTRWSSRLRENPVTGSTN
jgi:hypothetical protein